METKTVYHFGLVAHALIPVAALLLYYFGIGQWYNVAIALIVGAFGIVGMELMWSMHKLSREPY